MKLTDVQQQWQAWAESDQVFALLAHPDHIESCSDVDAFLAGGQRDIDEVMTIARAMGMCGFRDALDFGCGAGRLTQALATHFDRAVGVDIAESMIAKARQINRQGDRCEFVVNTAEDLSLFADASFDFVYSNLVLQHLEPRYAKRYIREFLRVVRPGGMAVFQLPEPFHLQGLKNALPEPVRRTARLLRGHRGPVVPMYGMSRDAVKQLVAASGGVVEGLRYTGMRAGRPAFMYGCRRT